jgi:hypothetical protein
LIKGCQRFFAINIGVFFETKFGLQQLPELFEENIAKQFKTSI